jgi:alpha-glucosidase (family GH31 glycosyl hydrolase)
MGRPPIVPVWYEWPEVESLHSNDQEILLGDALLVVPILVPDANWTIVEKPPGIWYGFWSGRILVNTTVPVTLDDTLVYIRGGRIVPKYEHPINNTIDTVKSPLTLIVALDENKRAEGSLYLDDGITYNYTLGVFLHRNFTYSDGELKWEKGCTKEKKVPEFLEGSIVENIVIYDSTGAKRFTGLKLLVAEEWSWKLPTMSESFGKTTGLGVLMAVPVALVIAVIVVKWRSSKNEIDSTALLSEERI